MHVLEIVRSDADCAVGELDHVQLVVLRASPSVKLLTAISDLHVAQYERVARKTLGFVYVESKLSLPDTETRKAASEINRARAQHMTCTATTLHGDGFWVSAAVAVVSAIQMLARPACPTRTFRDLSSAAQWSAEFTPVPAAELVRAMTQLRASKRDAAAPVDVD